MRLLLLLLLLTGGSGAEVGCSNQVEGSLQAAVGSSTQRVGTTQTEGTNTSEGKAVVEISPVIASSRLSA